MSNLLRVCLYDCETDHSEELAAQIGSLNFVRLIAVVSDEEELARKLQSGDANLVFFHLDSDPPAIVDVIESVSTRFPDLALIAISHHTNPEAILAPMRAGCDQFVCEPIMHEDLAAAVARVASKRSLATTASRCICVTGASGGAGATTLAANLALEIASLAGGECALVDMDFQFGDLASSFDCIPKYTIYDLASATSDIDRTVLTDSLADLGNGVALLARPAQINQHAFISPDHVHAMLAALTGAYENVVVDIPRIIDERTMAAFSHASTNLIVCQLLVPSIKNAKRFFDALVRGGVDADRIEVVVNRANSSGGRVTKVDVEEAVKKPPFAIIPNDYEYVAQSIDLGQPISAVDKRNPVRLAIHKVAARITGIESTREEEKGPRRGILGRLMSKP